MPLTPALDMPFASGLAVSSRRGLSQALVQDGPARALSAALTITRTYHPPRVYWRSMFGDDFAVCPFKSKLLAREQTMNGFQRCLDAGLTNVCDTDAWILQRELFEDENCTVVPYVGPWCEQDQRGSLVPLTYDRFATALAWLPTCGFSRLCIDGEGARGNRDVLGWTNRLGATLEIEAQAERRIDQLWCDVTSLTLSQAITRAPANTFYPRSDYGAPRYWLDNERGLINADYWSAFEHAISAGFHPCLPAIPSIWTAWAQRYGVSGG